MVFYRVAKSLESLKNLEFYNLGKKTGIQEVKRNFEKPGFLNKYQYKN